MLAAPLSKSAARCCTTECLDDSQRRIMDKDPSQPIEVGPGHNPERRAMIRNLSLLFVGNALLGAQMPMLVIMGGLAGVLLAPTPSLATFTISLQMLAALLTASPISLLMGRYGRRTGFLLGAGCAVAGGWLGTIALFEKDFLFLCMAHALFGVTQSSLWYFRFAAADAAHQAWKPRAIAIITGSGLIAALLGTEILIHAKDYFFPIPFAGAYTAIVLICLVGSLPVVFLDLPKPPRRGARGTRTPAPGPRQSACGGRRRLRDGGTFDDDLPDDADPPGDGRLRPVDRSVRRRRALACDRDVRPEFLPPDR